MSANVDSAAQSPWHAGEVALQRHIGVADYVRQHGSAWVRDHLIEQHRTFYPLLPFIAIGAVDPAGAVWATLRAGPPGFLQAPGTLQLDIAAPRDAADPAEAGMEDGDAVGLLGIDLITRRRNRLNGTVRRSGPASFSVAVGQSYGNCPRYIQNRHFAFTRDPAQVSPLPAQHLDAMDERARRMVREADTFFVASFVDLGEGPGGDRQVDVSHRGGRPGFVRVETRGAEDVLTVPDFNGNLLFNTLGNFMTNPKAGLLFVDHASGDVLQMTGRAEVVLDDAETSAFEGAERLWRFIPSHVVHRPQGLPLRWTFAEDGWSPNLRMTGNWLEAGQRLEAAALASSWRPFTVTAIVEESSSVRSLRLEPADGMALVPHRAGQHLPIRMGQGGALVRTYTLSTAPSDGYYRISVKKQGAASGHLHAARVGDTLEVQGPAGAFTIDARERRPAVLLAAGIGITPLLAMLRHLVHEGARTRHGRAVWLFYAARNKAERAFAAELQQLVTAAKGTVHLVRVLSAPEHTSTAEDYDVAGRIDLDLLKARLPFDDYDFYLCGPDAFMQATYDGLKSLNVAEARIHAEAFGPASLRRVKVVDVPALPPVAEAAVRVVFAKSGKEARWHPGDGDLLSLAESRGMAPAFGCRGGHCGTCKTKVLRGAVTYAEQPAYAVEADEVLLCRGLPSQASGDALHLQA